MCPGTWVLGFVRIAITGATGNVGTTLLRTLVHAGHDVVGIARRTPRRDAAMPVDSDSYSEPGRIEWRSIDLVRDPEPALREAFRGADAVVHLAWAFQPTHDQPYLERLDIGGTAKVLSAAAEVGIGHLLHMSSLGAYSPGEGSASEEWPVEGVPTSWYSRHKAAAEQLLDDFEAEHTGTLVTRMRPVLIGRQSAVSGVLRYVLPAAVPSGAIRLLKLLPLDRAFRLQLVHTSDVADAYLRAIEERVPGPFNLAAPPVLTPADIAAALGARPVHLPFSVLRAAADLSWHAHVQPVDAGWLDMAWQLPQLDASRARDVLGWTPRLDAKEVLREVVSGIRERSYDHTPILRRRTVRNGLRIALTGQPVAHRRQP